MYGKLFSQTFTGSLMGAGPEVFAVWSYVISNAVEGQVELNPKLLAAIIGMDQSAVIKSIEKLCEPDPDSRNPDEDGRRMVKEGQFAYRVVSHGIYRRMTDQDQRREYNRIKKREERARKKALKDNPPVKDVNNGQDVKDQVKECQPIQKQYTETNTKKENQPDPAPPGTGTAQDQDPWANLGITGKPLQCPKEEHTEVLNRIFNGVTQKKQELSQSKARSKNVS